MSLGPGDIDPKLLAEVEGWVLRGPAAALLPEDPRAGPQEEEDGVPERSLRLLPWMAVGVILGLLLTLGLYRPWEAL